ncbi:MAG: hypothetical protein HY293_02935 [Planctomycetes bacterium]|nr:hypothetical protein [Planctomycetota bacterium]
MGLFDFLRDPAALWTAEPGLSYEFDLGQASLCGVRLGSRPSGLSKLGPPTTSKPTKTGSYYWHLQGLEAFATKDILNYFCVTLHPIEGDGMSAYPGTLLLDGKPLALGPASRRDDVVRLLGEPWHAYEDADDPEVTLTLFYEQDPLEWEIEFLADGTIYTIGLNTPPSLQSPKSREYVRCDKPWPP